MGTSRERSGPGLRQPESESAVGPGADARFYEHEKRERERDLHGLSCDSVRGRSQIYEPSRRVSSFTVGAGKTPPARGWLEKRWEQVEMPCLGSRSSSSSESQHIEKFPLCYIKKGGIGHISSKPNLRRRISKAKLKKRQKKDPPLRPDQIRRQSHSHSYHSATFVSVFSTKKKKKKKGK